MSEWTDHDSVDLSVTLVAHDGHRLPLRGAERIAAIQIMADLGLGSEVMAIRLCINSAALIKVASRARIRIAGLDLRRWAVVADLGDLRERDRQRSQRVAA